MRTKVLSIYRSLLREATYLPDEAAQSYFRHWISHRFHAASKTDPEGFLKARKILHRLERANHGDKTALEWVLNNTYGRIGKKRRELITSLRAHGDEHLFPEDDSSVKELLEKRREGKTTTDGNQNSPAVKTKLEALLKSHTKVELVYARRPILRETEPQIPEKNTWGRPTPLKLRAGLEHRWWARSLAKLYPPLPLHEHKRLHNLAMGITPYSGQPPRRPSRQTSQPEPSPIISPIQMARFLQPISHVEQRPLEESYSNHKITPRYMRRLWMRVLTLCPVMTQDEDKKEWKVKWPGTRNLPIEDVVTNPCASDLELFEGSQETSVLQPKKKRGKK